MIWKKQTEKFDLETIRIIEISQYFLKEYFSNSEEKAEENISIFLNTHKSKIDEDLIHYFSSFRLAALIHYTVDKLEDFSRANEIIIEKGLHNPPQEALEYFRKNYFEEDLDNPFTKYPFMNDK